MVNKPREPLYERPDNRRYVVQGYMIFRPNRQFAPPTDVIELEDRLLVRVEIAGMRATDFSISLQNNHLIVSGERPRPTLQNAGYHQVEIGYGTFRVDVALPWSVDETTVAALYRDGFLQIELPRRETRQIHVIDVVSPEDTHDER